MKTLIVYYSHSANNAALAQELKRRLRCDIFRIEDAGRRTKFTIFLDRLLNRKPAIKEYNVNLGQYDNFIFVAPIWASGIATPLKTFLVRERQYINNYSFITLCRGRAGQVEKLREELNLHTQQEPERVCELWISDLIPQEKRDNPKFIMDFKLNPAHFAKFSDKIDQFIEDYHHEAVPR
jgi:hypothetical protein